MKKLVFLLLCLIPIFMNFSSNKSKLEGFSLLTQIEDNPTMVFRQEVTKFKEEEKRIKKAIDTSLKNIPSNDTHPGIFLEQTFGKPQLIKFKDQLPKIDDIDFYILNHKIKIQKNEFFTLIDNDSNIIETPSSSYLKIDLSNMYLASLDGLDEIIKEWIEIYNTEFQENNIKDIQLILDDAVIGKISTDTFKNFPLPVTELEKESIVIGTIEPYAFRGLDTITEWYWYGAFIEIIKNEAFAGMKELKNIIFTDSIIKIIATNAFKKEDNNDIYVLFKNNKLTFKSTEYAYCSSTEESEDEEDNNNNNKE